MCKIYRYYCLYRPPAPGAVPKDFTVAVPYDDRRYCPEVERMAWGYVEYDKPLTPQTVINYEMAVAGERNKQ